MVSNLRGAKRGARVELEEFKLLIDELTNKLLNTAIRFGFDPAADGFVERMAEISYGVPAAESGKSNQEWDRATWPERILAVGFRSTWLAGKDLEDADGVPNVARSLCLGNWCAGFLDGMPGPGDPAWDEFQEKSVRSKLAISAASQRYKHDPKQAAKAFVKECWQQWQDNPTRYKTQTAFANDVLTKIGTDRDGNPIISFDTIVKKWIPIWAKE